MRAFLLLSLVFMAAGCTNELRYTSTREVRFLRRGEPRWAPSIISLPPIQAAMSISKDTRDNMKDDVTVFGYDRGVQLHFSLHDASLASLLDVAGGLPKFGGPGRVHLGLVRAECALPGGEGYAFNFRNWHRRDALVLLADIAGRSIIVGPDVNDLIDVEVKGAPPIAILRLLADEGGVVILEDDGF
jgi:hypothetical protein